MVSFLLLIGLVFVIVSGQKRDQAKEKQIEKMLQQQSAMQYMKYLQEQDQQPAGPAVTTMSGIVCWGDSLTVGSGGNGSSYPAVLKTLLQKNNTKLSVINLGVSGEDTNAILSRAGAVPLMAASFKLPGDKTSVEVQLSTKSGGAVNILRHDDVGVNPCTIDGIEGTLSIKQRSALSKTYQYYFTRSAAGEAKTIAAGTPVITRASVAYKSDMPIIFIGQNGGFKDSADLIKQEQEMLKASSSPQYLILGLTTGTKASRHELETAMEKTFGKSFVNLREYLSTKGLKAAGIKPLKNDLAAMKQGSVPPSLLAGKVFLNSKGYTLIGNLVFERMKELGYVETPAAGN